MAIVAPLHTRGYVVHRRGVNVSRAAWLDINQQAKRCVPIFNHNNHAPNDLKRRQWRLHTRGKEATQALVDELRTAVLPLYTALSAINDVVILESLPGCQQQQYHTDYDMDELGRLERKEDMPLGILIALEDHTKLMVKGLARRPTTEGPRPRPGAAVNLNRGDVLIFRGDLIHAGAVYTQRNLRLHTFLDSGVVTRHANATYPTSSSPAWRS